MFFDMTREGESRKSMMLDAVSKRAVGAMRRSEKRPNLRVRTFEREFVVEGE
jgi:hypothetical protein